MTALADYESRAPAVPPDTCGVVDEVSGLLDSANEHLQHASAMLPHTTQSADAVWWALNSISNAQRTLELLRTANAQLRASGAYWHRAAREIAAMAEVTDM